MSDLEPGTITNALNAIGADGADAKDHRIALDVIYRRLRQMARKELSAEFGERTIQPTVLVHEAYMKLLGKKKMTWDSRAHFFGAAARAMRQVLVDEARKRKMRERRMGKRLSVLDESILPSNARGKLSPRPMDWLGLDRALEELAELDARGANIAELRLFSGLPIAAIGRMIGITERAAQRDWNSARAWLKRRLKDFDSEV